MSIVASVVSFVTSLSLVSVVVGFALRHYAPAVLAQIEAVVAPVWAAIKAKL
jgi:hypothetical protein